MRLLLFICPFLILAACVKRENPNPVPVVEFKDFRDPHRTKNGDTATFILSYEDGDGDLFVDRISQGPNLIFTPYYPNNGVLTAFFDDLTNDTIRYSTTIQQPDNGYYKGKSIKGEIYVPLTQFRPGNNYKEITFRGFMVDLKGRTSNIFASPIYTLDF